MKDEEDEKSDLDMQEQVVPAEKIKGTKKKKNIVPTPEPEPETTKESRMEKLAAAQERLAEAASLVIEDPELHVCQRIVLLMGRTNNRIFRYNN